jgi:hypothetical protein
VEPREPGFCLNFLTSLSLRFLTFLNYLIRGVILNGIKQFSVCSVTSANIGYYQSMNFSTQGPVLADLCLGRQNRGESSLVVTQFV